MDKIQIVDQTIRLAQQGLWGFMMRTDHIEPIAEVMDRVGYKAIGTVGGNGYVIQVRNLDEDPWERVRMLSRALKRTTLRGSYQIWGLADFEQTTPRDIIALWIRRCIANGIKSFWVCDYQTDMEKFAYFARIAKAEGAEVCVALVYASSPLHTNEHWARKVKLIAEVKDCVDAIVIGDPGGVLTPEYTREFLTTVQRNCDGIPIEFQAQCSSGLASITYVEAMKAGVTIMQTAVAPLANGTSMPSTESVLKNARRLGFTVDIDEDALAAESEHFRKIAEKEGFPLGVPMEYDLFYFEHQVPGGMMTNLTRQLREVKMEDRLGEILEEVVRVRKDFGYPVMATPYSQIVGAQAADNVISGERYKQVSDSTIKYVLGFYGEPVGPLDQNLVDRVMNAPRTKEFLIGHPAFILAVYLAVRGGVVNQRGAGATSATAGKDSADGRQDGQRAGSSAQHGAAADLRRRWLFWVAWPLLLAGVIGQLSMVNTFAHIHTPLAVSALRTALGLVFGSLIGILAIALVEIAGALGWRASRISAGDRPG